MALLCFSCFSFPVSPPRWGSWVPYVPKGAGLFYVYRFDIDSSSFRDLALFRTAARSVAFCNWNFMGRETLAVGFSLPIRVKFSIGTGQPNFVNIISHFSLPDFATAPWWDRLADSLTPNMIKCGIVVRSQSRNLIVDQQFLISYCQTYFQV